MHPLQAAEATKTSFIEYVTREWIGFLTFNSSMMNCILGCSTSTQNVGIVLPKILAAACVDKGMLFQSTQLLTNKPPTLILQAAVDKPLLESLQEAQSSPITLSLGQRTISYKSPGSFVKTD